MGEDRARLTSLPLTRHHPNQFLPEALTDHAVEQEVGGGVEVLQHVGQISGDVNGDAVVIPVKSLIVVLCSQDAVRNEARQAQHNKGRGDGTKQQDSPFQHAPSTLSTHGTALFLSEEVSGMAQVVSHGVIEDGHQENGQPPREERGHPHYGRGVGLATVTTPWQRHIVPVRGQVDGSDRVDPGQRHREHVREEDDGRTRQLGGSGPREVPLGFCAAEDEVTLDGEHHDDPGRAVERAMLQESQDGAPRFRVPKRLWYPEGERQVNEDHPHDVEGVHNGQAAQVNDGRVRHAAFTEADHVKREEVGWTTKQTNKQTLQLLTLSSTDFSQLRKT